VKEEDSGQAGQRNSLVHDDSQPPLLSYKAWGEKRVNGSGKPLLQSVSRLDPHVLHICLGAATAMEMVVHPSAVRHARVTAQLVCPNDLESIHPPEGMNAEQGRFGLSHVIDR